MKANLNAEDKKFLELVASEVEAARNKYPGWGVHRFVAFAGEAGEVLQAWAKHIIYQTPETWRHVRMELVQAAAMALRFFTEGDNTLQLPEKDLEPRLHHISECVPEELASMAPRPHPMDLMGDAGKELEAYRKLGTPEKIAEELGNLARTHKFLKESMAVMEANSQITDHDMKKRHEVEAKLTTAIEALEDIVTQLSSHPDAGDGVTKVHFCLLRAKGALEAAASKEPIGDQRLRKDLDETLAAAGWLAHIVLDDRNGSGTAEQWIARGKTFYRDALLIVKRHRHLFQLAKAELEKQAYGCADICPECGENRTSHNQKCGIFGLTLALEQAAMEDRRP